MEYLEKLKVYGDQVKNVVVKSMVDTAHGGQKMLKDVLPGNLVTREFEVKKKELLSFCILKNMIFFSSLLNHWDQQVRDFSGESMVQSNDRLNKFD